VRDPALDALAAGALKAWVTSPFDLVDVVAALLDASLPPA